MSWGARSWYLAGRRPSNMPRGSMTWSSTLTRIRSSACIVGPPSCRAFPDTRVTYLTRRRRSRARWDRGVSVAPARGSAWCPRRNSPGGPRECRGRQAAPGQDDVIDEAVGLGLLGGQVVIAVDIEGDLLDRSSRVVGDDLGHAGGEGQDLER